MPNQLVQHLQVNQDADRLWSTDKSKAYVASLNEGGWGAPNAERNESALLFIAERRGSTTTLLSPVSSNLFYNPADTNTTESSAEFIFAQDGHHRVTLLQFDVSTDGTTLVKDGAAIPNDTYYYYDGAIYFRSGGVGELIDEDEYSTEFLENEDIVQDYAENIFFPKLSRTLTDLYESYKSARDTNPDDAEYQYRRFRDLRFDLESAYNLFWSGLTVQANDLIESLTSKYIDQPQY